MAWLDGREEACWRWHFTLSARGETVVSAKDITYLRYNQAPGWRCILLLCSEGRFVSSPTWTVDGQLAQWQNGVLGSDGLGGRDEVDKYASLFIFPFKLLLLWNVLFIGLEHITLSR
jgi:hypothetical protein